MVFSSSFKAYKKNHFNLFESCENIGSHTIRILSYRIEAINISFNGVFLNFTPIKSISIVQD